MFQQKTDNSQLGWNFSIKRCLDENIRALKDSRSLTGLHSIHLPIHLLVPADVSIFLYHYRCDDNSMELKFCHMRDLSLLINEIVGTDHNIPQLPPDNSIYSD